MTPPRRDPLEEARRRLDEAAGALDGMRRVTGEDAEPGVRSGESASESVRREALAAAREDLRRMAAELEIARARGEALQDELGRLRGELAERPKAHELTEARAAGELSASRRAAELASQVAGLKERVALLSAEHVRLESLRRKAEAVAAEAEASRRSLEETLRRDLRATHGALDRAAAEAGARDAKAVTDIEELRKRLDHALNRLQRDGREDLLRKQKIVEETSYKGDFEAASAVIASLRGELTQQRTEALGRENALNLRVHELERRLSGALSPGGAAMLEEVGRLRDELAARPTARELEDTRGVAEALREELRTAHAARDREDQARRQDNTGAPSLRGELDAAQSVIASLRRELSEQREEAMGRVRALELLAQKLEKRLAAAQPLALPPSTELIYQVGDESGVAYPSLEYALEPGWARLLALVRPPLLAAYGHLRRLSSGSMSAGSRAIVRMTGSSLSQASDALATIELALADSPATAAAAPVLPVLEAALAAWEAVLRRRGIALTREFSRTVPDSPHDPEQLRLALHHVLRNAVEALPRGSTLRVSLGKFEPDGVRLEFRDDGPGYPTAWLTRRFEPFVSPRPGHAGLGLAAVSRALSRWGGNASASNAANGRGACLTMTFATAPALPATKS